MSASVLMLDARAAHARAAGLTVGIAGGLDRHGTHGRGGVKRALLGSVAARVVRLASGSVLTVREPS